MEVRKPSGSVQPSLFARTEPGSGPSPPGSGKKHGIHSWVERYASCPVRHRLTNTSQRPSAGFPTGWLATRPPRMSAGPPASPTPPPRRSRQRPRPRSGRACGASSGTSPPEPRGPGGSWPAGRPGARTPPSAPPARPRSGPSGPGRRLPLHPHPPSWTALRSRWTGRGTLPHSGGADQGECATLRLSRLRRMLVYNGSPMVATEALNTKGTVLANGGGELNAQTAEQQRQP